MEQESKKQRAYIDKLLVAICLYMPQFLTYLFISLESLTYHHNSAENEGISRVFSE